MSETGTISDVALGDASALVEVMHTQEAVLVTASSDLMRRTHFLPSSQFGLALPITIDGQVGAVLDVQNSEQPFSQADIAALKILGRQLGALLTDIRQVVALRESLEEERTTTANLRRRLQDYKEAERQVVTRAWSSYLDERTRQAIGFDVIEEGDDVRLVPAEDLPEPLQAAMHRGETVVEAEGGAQVIRVPIQVRGETLGVMAFTLDTTEAITERQIEFAETVVNRLALALENKRLYERSQSQALRERRANEIAGLLIGATDVADVISLASSSFNEALGAVRTRISLEANALEIDRPANQNGGSAHS
jgi:GAF domain-containing protein